MRLSYNGDEYVVPETELDRFIEDVIENIDEDDIETSLSEIFPEPVEVCGYEYDQVSLLKEIDPIAYSLMVDEYKDSIAQDALYDLKRAGEDDTVYIFTEEVTVLSEDDEEDEDD